MMTKDLRLSVVIILVAVLVANYVYTFNGTVVYTSEERTAVSLWNHVSEVKRNNPEKTEQQIKIILDRDFSDEEIKILSKYKNTFKETQRVKTIQQFYLESGFVFLVVGLLLFWKRK
jgi:hypothetical protein